MKGCNRAATWGDYCALHADMDKKKSSKKKAKTGQKKVKFKDLAT